MTPQEQEFPHDPENGIFGDCFRASLASLLDLPIIGVPHFLYDGDADKWTERLNAFLSPMGYFMMTVSAHGWDFAGWKSAMNIDRPIFHLMSDVSPRFPSELHSVVACRMKLACAT